MVENKFKYKRIEAACEIFGCGRKKMRQMALTAVTGLSLYTSNRRKRNYG